jgi:hypothetical protein
MSPDFDTRIHADVWLQGLCGGVAVSASCAGEEGRLRGDRRHPRAGPHRLHPASAQTHSGQFLSYAICVWALVQCPVVHQHACLSISLTDLQSTFSNLPMTVTLVY